VTANGPAIKGGCVTRRKHRAESRYFSQKTVTVQGGYGALFAVQVQVLWIIRVSRYKFDRSYEFIPGYKVGCMHWRSVAIQTVSEPEIYQGAGFKLRADARIRVQQPLQICLRCRSKSKKCDKQLTFIVRVIVRFICFLLYLL
jgi:hypothetical protein